MYTQGLMGWGYMRLCCHLVCSRSLIGILTPRLWTAGVYKTMFIEFLSCIKIAILSKKWAWFYVLGIKGINTKKPRRFSEGADCLHFALSTWVRSLTFYWIFILKIFKGPKDRTEHAYGIFNQPSIAKFVRIVPQTWVGFVAVRFDVIGCNPTGSDVTVDDLLTETNKKTYW